MGAGGTAICGLLVRDVRREGAWAATNERCVALGFDGELEDMTLGGEDWNT
jgi:hypothetical protein